MAVTLNANTSTGFIATSDTSGVLQLQTAGTTAVTVNASQNVGIGTSSPAKQLDLAASNTGITTGDPLNTLRFTDTDTTSAAGQPMGRIEWYSSDADTAGVKAYIQAQSTDGSPDADMVFATNHVSGGGTAERMRIQYDGNVGIGTSSPAQKLQVNGKAIIGTYAGTGAYGLYLRSDAENTHYNWQISTQHTVNGAIEFARSTAVGGSTFNSPSVVIDLNGNLLVGTTTAITTGRFVLKAPATTNLGEWRVTTNGYGMIMYNASDTQVGFISINASTTTYNTGSDYRLKENIAPMTGALAKVAQLKPCTYTWRATGKDGQGFIAHELSEVVPDAVSGEKDDVDAEGNPRYQGVDTSFLVATLTAAIQEQQAIIQTLTDRITALEGTTP